MIVDPSKIETIPLGIVFFLLFILEYWKRTIKEYGIDNDYILYAGTANPRKNLVNLVHAYIDIINDISQDLVIVGPVNTDYIVQIIKNYVKSEVSVKGILNRIKVLGYVKFLYAII
jgi:glycosyltransferase involved in cell wall biosynthesis